MVPSLMQSNTVRFLQRSIRSRCPDSRAAVSAHTRCVRRSWPRAVSRTSKWNHRLGSVASPRPCSSQDPVLERLREWRRERAEVYVPLVHRPGESAQVDFFEVTAEISGERCKAWLFLMRLMHSGRDCVWLYERQDQLAFLDGHVRAFAHFGGVPRRTVYDNLSAAVRRVQFPRRALHHSWADWLWWRGVQIDRRRAGVARRPIRYIPTVLGEPWV